MGAERLDAGSGRAAAGISPLWLLRIFIGCVLIWLVLDQSASRLGSLRGEAGLLVCLLTLFAACAVDVLLMRTSPRAVFAGIGLGRPKAAGMLAAGLVSLLLVITLPLCAHLAGASLTLRSDWLILLPGLFAQHGIAEETLFRGFVFGHLRRRCNFWRAVLWSMLPFALVHLPLLATQELPVALSSIALALISSVPLALLYERAGRTIWAPALLHFAMHAIKLVAVPDEKYPMFAVAWIAASAIVPYLLFIQLKKALLMPGNYKKTL